MIISTPRLLLRPFTPEDITPFTELTSDPDVMRYIGNGDVQTYDQTKTSVLKFMDLYEQKGYSLLAVIYKENHQFVGFCGLIDQTVDEQPCVELGYRLSKNYWNQKIATEAANAVKEYAFETLNLPKVISIIQPGNLASRRIAEKLGMSVEKETIFHSIPVLIYSLENSA